MNGSQILKNDALKREASAIVSGIADDEEARTEMAQITLQLLDDGLTIIALDEPSDTILGFHMHKFVVKPKPNEPTFYETVLKTVKSPLIKNGFEFSVHATGDADIFKYFNCEAYIDAILMAIPKEHANKSIGLQIAQADYREIIESFRHGREIETLNPVYKGIKPGAYCAIYTSDFSVKIGEKAYGNLVCLAEKSFDSFAGGRKNIPGIHKSTKLLCHKI